MPPMPMPPPQQGGAAPSNMPPQMAMQVLQKFGISPQDVPMVAAAIQTLMQSGALSGAGGGQSEPPPQPGPPAGQDQLAKALAG